ncbi:hypothetical protein ACS0TY_013715 [Phlomoides rotata]
MKSFIVIMTNVFFLLRSRDLNGSSSVGKYMNDNDVTCKDHIRMNSNYFNLVCYLLKNLGGLRSTRNVSINEQVAIFLTIMSHHTKNRVVKHTFRHSRYTISKHFNNYTVLLVKPVLVPEESTDNRWKYFKGMEI